MAATSTRSGDRSDEPYGREDRSVRTWIRLARVYGRMLRALEAQLREHGLTVGQFDVLAHVARAEGLNQQELADALLVTKGNVSHLLDRLEGAGLVERRQGPGRACRLYPTAAGRELLARVTPPHVARIAELLASLDLDRLTVLHQTLRDLDRAAE